MPGKQQIEFIIKPDGSVEERVTGMTGPDCVEQTADIEHALGDVVEREHTSDYYKNQQQSDNTVSTGS
ncbi:MAG: DUF2997 domain-containing protein [Anaerolineae bacterium]|nr:DUF2997 domain-containing protein [Anaerolineae bacterium]